MKHEEICGYCLSCHEWKDDDYGMWHIENEHSDNPEIIKTSRGCRQCGFELLSIEDAKTVRDHLVEVLDELENG